MPSNTQPPINNGTTTLSDIFVMYIIFLLLSYVCVVFISRRDHEVVAIIFFVLAKKVGIGP